MDRSNKRRLDKMECEARITEERPPVRYVDASELDAMVAGRWDPGAGVRYIFENRPEGEVDGRRYVVITGEDAVVVLPDNGRD